jgi:hypothetical protein
LLDEKVEVNVDAILAKNAAGALFDLNQELIPGKAPTMMAMKFSVKLRGAD